MCIYVENYNYRKKKHVDFYFKMQIFKQNCNSTFSVTTLFYITRSYLNTLNPEW